MLVVHPDSCCDICNEAYDGKRAPYAIACGHIFCCDCLQKCSPSHCPVCRGVYRKEKIKKLHVETTIVGRDEITRVSSPSAIAEYLQMVAMVSGEGVLDVEVEKVSARVDEWIASLPQNMKLQSQPVRLALGSVKRARKALQDLETARTERLATERKLDRVMDDVRCAKLVEDGLLQSNHDTHEQLEVLQKRYDLLLAETSQSQPRDRSNSRSNKQGELKANGTNKSAHPEAVYTITPGAPHSERVLPTTQRKSAQKPIPTEAEPRTEHRHHRSRSDQVPRGLGLHINGSSPNWSGGEDSVSTPTMGSNGPRRHLNAMNSVENLSILSPPDSHSSLTRQNLHELFSSSASSPATAASTPPVSTPSTLSWGTSIGSVSSISVGDMSLTGLPAFPSGSSLNLGVSGLHDFDHTTPADEVDGYGSDENVMTPSIRRQPELTQRGYNSGSDSGSDPRYQNRQRFESHSAAGNRRPSVNGQSGAAETRNHDGPAPPRPMGRSISDNTPAMPGSRSSDHDEAELEVIGMRFSQSLPDIEPTQYGYGSASTPSSFEDPAPIRSGVRRASIATPSVRGLDLEIVEAVRRSSDSPARPVPHRSVTFATPKPDELPPKKHRDQGQYGHPPMHGPRGAVPNLNSTFTIPYPENTKGLPISSRRGPGDDLTRRGLATVAAPTRDLPPAFDPTYTTVGSSNRPLPSMHQSTPPLPHQHGRKEGQQQKQSAATRTAPPQPGNAPSMDVSTRVPPQKKPTVSANVPIVAPQPVNPIRPWKWNGKAT